MFSSREIKASLGYTIGNIMIKGISFVTLPIFSRLLTTAQFGIYNSYYAYESIVSILIGLGMYASIKNANIDYKDEIDKYVSTIIRVTFVPLITFITTTLIFKDPISKLLDLEWFLIVVMIVHSFGTAMLQISNSKLALKYNYKKYLAYALFNTITNVVMSLLLITTVFSNQREYGRIIGSAIPMVLIAIHIVLTNGLFGFSKEMSSYGLKIGLPLIWHYLSQTIQNHFDKIALKKLKDNSSAGIYSFSYTIAGILQIIFYSAETVYSVWMYKKMKEEDYKEIKRITFYFMEVIAFIAIGMLVFSKEGILIVGGEKYREGIDVFIPICLGMYALFMYTIPVNIEYYFKETKYIAASTAFAALINIILNFIFIPKYNYVGAAFTTLISYLIQFSIHWVISKKVLRKNNIESVYSLKDILMVFAVVCATGIVVYFLNPYPVVKYLVFVVVAAIVAYIKRNDMLTLYNMLIKKGG